MSDQIESTPEPEVKQDLVVQIADEMDRRAKKARDEAEEAGIEAGLKAAKEATRETLKQAHTDTGAVDAAIAAQDSEAARGAEEQRAQEARPYGAAGRTLPSDLRDARYQRLARQGRDYRSADADVLCQRWLVAMSQGNSVLLTEMAAADVVTRQRLGLDYQRAPLAIGAPGANFGVSGGTAAQFVPLELADVVQAVVYRKARLRRWAMPFEAGVSDNLRLPMQDAAPTVQYTAEGVAITPGEPTAADGVKLDLVQLTSLNDITDQLLLSTPFNVGNWLDRQVGEKMAEFEDLKMYRDGDGVNEPAGFEAKDTTTATTPAESFVPVKTDQTGANDFLDPATLTAPHVKKMFFALPEAHRGGAIWMGSDTVAEILSNLTDGQGRDVLNMQNAPSSIVGDAESSGEVGTLHNRPFINMPGKEDITATPPEDTNRLYFAAMDRSYAILERGGIQAASSVDFKFNQRLTTFRFIRDADGQPTGNRTSGLPVDYVYTGSLIPA